MTIAARVALPVAVLIALPVALASAVRIARSSAFRVAASVVSPVAGIEVVAHSTDAHNSPKVSVRSNARNLTGVVMQAICTDVFKVDVPIIP